MRQRGTPASTVADWSGVDAAAAARALAVDARVGLPAREVAERLAAHGPNAIGEARRRSALTIFARQLRDVMVLVLVAAALVASVVGEPQDTVAIVAIVVLNAVLGFVQEHRAERAIAALRALAAPQARVRRDGALGVVPATALVPGDVVLLEAGNVVPADLRLIEAVQLQADEAALTGESRPVEKTAAPLAVPEPALADRVNMAWKGTTVAYGRGTGLVVATGMRTELGRIASLLARTPDVRTPLQRRLDVFARRLASVVLALCAVIFVVGLLRGEAPALMFLTALSLAVAAVPEALPAVVTVALALGARRMAARHALVRRLPAVEALGSVTCICSDKTGTLTANRNAVCEVRLAGHGPVAPDALPGGEPGALLRVALALSNDVRPAGDRGLDGDPTEVALLRAALEAGADRGALAAAWPRVAEIPFSSDRGRMTTIHRHGGRHVAFTKGAPETVLVRCARDVGPAGARGLDRRAWEAIAADMAGRGQRVLAVAYRGLERLDEAGDPERVECDLTLLALVGLLDPPRPEVPAAVALCRTAGIDVRMITGDHPATAGAVARSLGIGGDTPRVLTGPALARLGAAGLPAALAETRVFARVAPEQKIDIVAALQARGDAVAMTGDGVNDAPALRRADVGVAMGRGGTEVAREAAHLVLLDDNFATLVAAVREGRRIYDDIRKFIRYVLTGNSGEIWTLFLAPLVGLPVPLLPIHILWVNLVTDGLPGLALAVEPAEDDVMRRPPRPPSESVFAHGLGAHVFWIGLLIAALTLATQAWALRAGAPAWQSMTLTVLTLCQLFHVLAIRVERQSVLAPGARSNPWLLAAVLGTVALQLAILYLPPLQAIFRTAPLTAGELGVCLGMAAVVFVVVELEKAVRRRGFVAEVR